MSSITLRLRDPDIDSTYTTFPKKEMTIKEIKMFLKLETGTWMQGQNAFRRPEVWQGQKAFQGPSVPTHSYQINLHTSDKKFLKTDQFYDDTVTVDLSRYQWYSYTLIRI